MKKGQKRQKVLLLISLSNNLGGAQIRYVSLFEELEKRGDSYVFVINQLLCSLYRKAGYLKDLANVYIVEDDRVSEVLTQKAPIENKTSKTVNTPRKLLWSRQIIRFSRTFITFCKLEFRLLFLFRQLKPDYVYAIWMGGMLAWPLKYVFKFRFVYAYMDSGFSSIYSKWSMPLKNEHLPLLHADKIDFLSQSLANEVQDRVDVRLDQISVSPNSFKIYDQFFPDSIKENSVVFCSRLEPIKNPLLYLKAVLLYNQNHVIGESEKVKFYLLGDGPDFEKAETFKREHNLWNVEMPGFVPYPQEYFKKSKIFVSIQQSNNYPSQSLLEAMACGNAIIASDVGETRKLVDDKVGLLVELNAQALANAFEQVLANQVLQTTMALEARQRVLENHNVEKFLEYFQSLQVDV
jgi:glycosyltransferase involved in cell wall biosynthesis